eukprot:3488488-Amphidinium_carterae.1
MAKQLPVHFLRHWPLAIISDYHMIYFTVLRTSTSQQLVLENDLKLHPPGGGVKPTGNASASVQPSKKF